MFKKESNNLLNISMSIIVFFIVFYILYIGASLIIPFIIALLFSFAIIGLSNYFRSFKIPVIISFILSLGTYIFIIWLLWKMLGTNLQDLIRLLPDYQQKVYNMLSQAFQYFHIPVPASLGEILSSLNLQSIFTSVLSGFTSIFSSAGIILFYVLFILLEYRYFKKKLNLMMLDDNNKKNVIETIEKIKRDIKSYFVIKTIVSLITALLSYIIMMLFGLDFALFWSLLIFILNFIPNIGSIIAVLLASLFSLIQFDSYYSFLLIISGLTSIQVLMGNIIEPKYMGNKLNLSPLVIIIALGFWGAIWGIVGMILSVPIMVILNIIFAKIPSTRNIAIFMSEKGELQIDGAEEVIKTRKKIVHIVANKIFKNNK
ncbi:MAG: AI-2E family transporter [Candidatus Gracilibacteria bacterium]|nr:AI-2E family transporter [Candidatus Gracilibacteria bacterium]